MVVITIPIIDDEYFPVAAVGDDAVDITLCMDVHMEFTDQLMCSIIPYYSDKSIATLVL